MPRGVADDALHIAAHLLRRDCARYREPQEAGRHDGDEPHRKEVDEFEARIGLVDVMKNEIGLTVEEPLPRAGDRFEMKMEPCARATIEEAAQQRERLRQRAEIADDHAQFALFAHGELRRMRLERAQLVEEDARMLVKGPSRLGQADAIAAAVEQRETELL